jgi:D-threo-aldose 1-dehydrogenase
MPAAFGYEVEAEQAIELVRAVLDSPVNVVDTSNEYSGGESERRIGQAVARAGGLAPGRLVVTKVDALGRDYSGERVRQSVRESKERLGLDVLPLVHLHDPEYHDERDLMGPGGAVEALVRLRDEGEIGHIGVAAGDVRVLSRYLDLGVFEALLVHNRWTLVDRSADALLDRAAGEGLGVFNAAIYGGGILANPGGAHTSYGYRPLRRATADAVRRMAEACGRHGTDLATAALQFSLREPRIHSTVVGISKPSRLAALLDAVDTDLPQALWDELETLVPTPENWLDAE